MNFTRRAALRLLGLTALGGCTEVIEIVPVDRFEDGGWDPSDELPDDIPPEDIEPDQEYPADPSGLDGGTDPEPEPELDGGTQATDAGTTSDAGTTPSDAGTTSDAGAPSDAGTTPDAGTPAIEDFDHLPVRSNAFPAGVMAGDATDTSILFWTKFTGTANLSLRVYEMRGAQIVATRFNGAVSANAAGFVRVIVNGLRPNRLHRYAFLTGPTGAPTGRSDIGRVRTALGPDSLATIRFAGTSCTNLNHAPLPAMGSAGSRTDLDFFIHGGDHVYTDMGPGGAAFTLAEYRAKYQRQWNIPGLAALHASVGLYKSWDDHEVANNWDPETISAARLGNARKAFFENSAIRRNSVDAARIWRSFRWGKTAEVFLLDCRGERKPSTRSANPSNPSVYISAEQMKWLKTGLANSPCVFKFIVNSVPIFDRPGPNGSGGDNWSSYASQRQEILNHISNRGLRGVVWLSGDVHYGGVTTVERSGPHRDIWEVIMGPGGANSQNPPNLDPTWWPARAVAVHNYTVINADPVARRLRVQYVDGSGTVIQGGTWTHVF